MPPGGPSAPLVRSRRTNSHISRSPCDNHKVLTVWLWSMRHISSNHDGQICTINDKPDHSVCEEKECSWFVESYGILQEETECLCLNFHQWRSVNLMCICTLRVCMHVKKESCSMFHSSQGRKSLTLRLLMSYIYYISSLRFKGKYPLNRANDAITQKKI